MAKKKGKKTQAKKKDTAAEHGKVRHGETIFICVECGGFLKKLKSGAYHPAFLSRSFKCMQCGRETDQYMVQRKKVFL